MKATLNKDKIIKLFNSLNRALSKENIRGEIYLVGGAVMALAYNARSSTKDIDGYFVPKEKIRKLAQKVGEKEGVGGDWLNDAVKGFLGDKGKFEIFLELDHLKIYVAQAEFLLATKCLAFRIGEEFHDEDDTRYLLRFLNIEKYKDAIDVIKKYYPIEQFPQKTLYALEEILGK